MEVIFFYNINRSRVQIMLVSILAWILNVLMSNKVITTRSSRNAFLRFSMIFQEYLDWHSRRVISRYCVSSFQLDKLFTYLLSYRQFHIISTVLSKQINLIQCTSWSIIELLLRLLLNQLVLSYLILVLVIIFRQNTWRRFQLIKFQVCERGII
ncbi:transmembrane protein, putative (macronuclear) [Tetrahymena thermophila SB210]|uniref:Transmembrane protein, putative n=1 Tax=Tetrahymena thermophila (strain SB210) TaxID=312017 RepID=W7XHW1_TETTS|nr:transmembrane protein, putative [Tetrahymena thermophila SB210]EWS74101.1 transmembrane protein, putative [Tetrahymena thermophila SB210]|eukprot:XP_012653356.1 transmembrane protein, putative [Tetrahymena thermophila SB210]